MEGNDVVTMLSDAVLRVVEEARESERVYATEQETSDPGPTPGPTRGGGGGAGSVRDQELQRVWRGGGGGGAALGRPEPVNTEHIEVRAGLEDDIDNEAVTLRETDGRKMVFVLDIGDGVSFYPNGMRFRPLTVGDLLRNGYVREGDKGLFLARINHKLGELLRRPDLAGPVGDALASAAIDSDTARDTIRGPRTR